MRISTIQAFNTSVRGIQDNYSAAMRTQEQINSGKRLLSPADDPVASVRLLQLDQEASRLSQYKDNLTAATNSLTQQEAVLNSVNNILQRVREIALSAGNGALDAGGRQALAQELAEREDELYGLLNSQNARGEYLFGGFKSDARPFERQADGSYRYQGDEGQRSIQIGSSRMVAINDNGKELFVDVPNASRLEMAASSREGYIAQAGVVDEAALYPGAGFRVTIHREATDPSLPEDAETNPVIDKYSITNADGSPVLDDNGGPVPDYTDADGNPLRLALEPNADGNYDISYAGMTVTLSGDLAADDHFTVGHREKQGVLDTVRQLRQVLENPGEADIDGQRLAVALSFSLQNIDNAIGQVDGVRTSLGARLNVIESTQLENDEATLINTQVQSGLKDLDYAEALSRLSMQSIVLQAAQQSFVKTSNLSLFNFLR